MTNAELISLFSMVGVAVFTIYWNVKTANKNISHDDKKELWKAVNDNKHSSDKAVEEIKDVIKANYWDSSRTKEYYDLRTDVKIDHLEAKINSLESSLGNVNTKLDIVINNMSIKE